MATNTGRSQKREMSEISASTIAAAAETALHMPKKLEWSDSNYKMIVPTMFKEATDRLEDNLLETVK